MTTRPLLTVIVPAYNALKTVRACLEGITTSDLSRERFELILVDDGSTDETSLIAAEYCDRVMRLSGKAHGPAFARNRGAEVSRGEVLVFVDADVIVHSDALRRLAVRFEAEPESSAIFGSYDDRPASPGLVSQYRNLLHHYVHQRGRGVAQTFWAGLGAIRRSEFLSAGGFDEWHYASPQIEDIELGRRVHLAGRRIMLDPDILGTHLKKWTLGSTLLADFRHRGVPWMWLILQEGAPAKSGSLNVRAFEKVLTGLAGVALLMPWVALFTKHAQWLLVSVAIAVLIGLANTRFYVFLLRARGPLFAMSVVPLHLAYYAGNSVSVIIGWFVHHLFGEPIPPAESAAHAQIGIATWPPPPRRSQQSLWEQRRPGDQ
jgi:glycosyltransferase involved in cell wall biosynthesis